MPETSGGRSCSTCRYAEPVMVGPDRDDPRLECRRLPPALITLGGEPVTICPQVQADDWCGEHQPTAPTIPMVAGAGSYQVVSTSVVLHGGGDTYIPLPDGSEVIVSIGG